MSTRNVLGNTTGFKALGNKTIPPISNNPFSWYRNPSWLPLPTVLSSEQKFVGLYAIYPDANFVALTASGAYTVNWGDGTTQNFSSGTQANYQYQFSDTDLNNTNAPVTFQETANTVTRNNHGYVNGMTVSFSEVTTTTGIVASQIYYVVGATTNTFQVSATAGGAPIVLTNNGTGVILPYKQVVVTVTPQAGQNITSFNLNVRNNSAGSPSLVYTAGWLDIALSLPSCTSLTISGLTAQVLFSLLEQVNLVNVTAVSSFLNMFWNCRKLSNVVQINSLIANNTAGMFVNCFSLQTVPLFNTSNVTAMDNMFSGCYALQEVPLFNTENVTNMSGMFSTCRVLQTIPLFNTAKVTNMLQMFTTCGSLQTVPLFNTTNVTNMQGTFLSCAALQEVPLFNTQKVTDMSTMFNGCAALQEVPLFNTANVLNMSSMLSACTSLKKVPPFNTIKVTNMSSMFSGCQSLKEVPALDTSNVTVMNNMFSGCQCLTATPSFNTVKVTNMTTMFVNCIALQTIGQLNGTAVTTLTSLFSGCSSLSALKIINFKITFSVASCKLSATALNEIYTNLPTVTGQTITVTGNYGTTSDNPAIAQAKGWTVSG